MDGINKNLNSSASLASLVSPDNFVKLDSNLQSQIIASVSDNNPQKGGMMGKLLGTDSKNVSMHIALILCISLILLIVIDFVHAYCVSQEVNMELVNKIIPVVTLSLGYIFGKGSS